MVRKSSIISALGMIDLPMMKLDAGEIRTFQAINQPARSINFPEIVEGLKTIPNLFIQSMLIDGDVSNIHGENFIHWVRTLANLRPRTVHIYSVERPTADGSVKSVPKNVLEKIRKDFQANYNLNVQIFWRE